MVFFCPMIPYTCLSTLDSFFLFLLGRTQKKIVIGQLASQNNNGKCLAFNECKTTMELFSFVNLILLLRDLIDDCSSSDKSAGLNLLC